MLTVSTLTNANKPPTKTTQTLPTTSQPPNQKNTQTLQAGTRNNYNKLTLKNDGVEKWTTGKNSYEISAI